MADPFHDVPETFVDSKGAFDTFVGEVLAAGDLEACAIDTEADSMHSYETKLCLIQFAVPGRLAIIDPLAIGTEAMAAVPDFLDRFDKIWMHGADYDISMFQMTFQWVPKLILDTQIAARLLGWPRFGLANLLESEYGVKVSKQSQKADWSRRPLSAKMLDYAYNDVRYLLDLGERFETRLEEAGRHDWFLESCRAARESVMDREGRPEDEMWRISGWGRLSPKGLNFLRHLWLWRDEECRKLDRPAFKFVGNHELIRMAGNLEGDRDPSPPHFLKPKYVSRLHAAIGEARKTPTSDFPTKRVRGKGLRLDIDEKKFERIRSFRNKQAEKLAIEGTLIATRQTMERLASTNLQDEEREGILLSWQRRVMDPILNEEGTGGTASGMPE